MSRTDLDLIADMKRRELYLKRAQRAADLISHRLRRYRGGLLTLSGVVVAILVVAIFFTASGSLFYRPGGWPATIVICLVGVILGVFVGHALLRTRSGRRLIARKERKLTDEYGGDLETRRRWLPFYYQGEDISAHVPQILYFTDAEQRFDSVRAAVTFIKSNPREMSEFTKKARERFDTVTADTNLLVISSTDESGRPSSRIMRFVTSDRPGLWYVTTAPRGPKVREFDNGQIAIVTVPTQSRATISSNRVQIRRLGASFQTVADLYRAQVPGYVDAMTEEESHQELVYALTFQSVQVDTWTDLDLIEFDHPDEHHG